MVRSSVLVSIPVICYLSAAAVRRGGLRYADNKFPTGRQPNMCAVYFSHNIYHNSKNSEPARANLAGPGLAGSAAATPHQQTPKPPYLLVNQVLGGRWVAARPTMEGL